ncbi:MAG: zinc ribbon domain-containing protein [Puniceicoccaceae bacterium]|nr:MAG: zinc ribbon domain-containing protein [Puniceicoccaceae bacterium]
MTTYVYETIPEHHGDKPEMFEVRQSMKDDPLTHHPKSGVPVRRVILGGFGMMKKDASTGPAPGTQGCGAGCGCHH